MDNVISIDAKTKNQTAMHREHMIELLEDALKRAKEGTTQGLVLCEVSDPHHYHSGAGRCCSHAMVGLLTCCSIDIANRINGYLEDADEDDAG